jgi:hypothetical protein
MTWFGPLAHTTACVVSRETLPDRWDRHPGRRFPG